MLVVSNNEFADICNWAINSLPNNYISNLKNVAIVIEDEPSQEQRTKMHIIDGVLLYGLYEGIPLTKRSSNYSLTIPDKITIFKKPILQNCSNLTELKNQVKRTVWHEIAHHYGLDHKDINKLINK